MKTTDSLGKKSVVILGSTGSIGTQALEIIENKSSEFSVCGLSGNKNWKLLASQVNQFKPDFVVLSDESNRESFENSLTHKPKNY